MADIDDELLALAGGSESESEGHASDREATRRRGSGRSGRRDDDSDDERDRSRSPVRGASRSSRSIASLHSGRSSVVSARSRDRSLSRGRSRSASRSRKSVSVRSSSSQGGGRRRGSRKLDGNESGDEHGRSSAPGTPNSLDSAPMDESDSDAEVAPRTTSYQDNDDENKYPYEGLYKNRAEKEDIENMVEFEREQLLADRAAEVEKLRQSRILRQFVKTQDSDDKKKKRTADAAELDDDGLARKASRQRTTRPEGGKPGEASSALDTLRRAKAEKNDRQRRREEKRDRDARSSPRRSRSRSRSSFSDRSRGSRDSRSPRRRRRRQRSSSPYESREAKPKPKPRPILPAEIRDVERLRVGRHRFSEVCYTPGFAKAMVGCYTRINVGPSPETGVDQYRMAMIQEIITGRPYAMEGHSGIFVTDQYVKAAHGAAGREFPFIACSDRPFTEGEWNRYKITCANDNVTIPDKGTLSDKIADINGLINHKWTGDEIEGKLQRKKDLRRRFDPIERERIGKQITLAREQGHQKYADELQAELDSLASSRLAFRTSLNTARKPDSGVASQQDRLAQRNLENRRRNAEEVRRAQIKEKQAARELEARIARGEVVEGEDHSRRLKTKAKFVHNVDELPVSPEKKKQDAAAAAAAAAAQLEKDKHTAQTVLPHLLKLQQEKHKVSGGMPTIHRPLVDDDIIGALDLDIDVEI